MDIITLALAKKYTKETMAGAGAIKGDPGVGITSIVKVSTNGLIDTYKITYSDGSTWEYQVKNGADGKSGVNGANGTTPHIDPASKNWFIGLTDTGIAAEGSDGFSPTIEVSPKVDGKTTLTITDVNGEKQVEIKDGENATGGTSTGFLFPIKGKKLVVLGDSLSSANLPTGTGTMDNPGMGSWPKMLRDKLELDANSRVIANGGCSLTDKDATTLAPARTDWTVANNVMSNQVYMILDHYKRTKGTINEYIPDIFLLMFGTNNVSTTYPVTNWDNVLGNFDTCMFDTDLSRKHYEMIDTSTTEGKADYDYLKTFRKTVYGSYRWAIETLLDTFPKAQIYIMQPLQNSNDRGRNLFDFYGSLEKISNFYGIKLIKTAYESNLSYFSNMRTGKGWSKSWYTFDGTHPDAAGQELVSNYVATVLASSYFTKPTPNSVKEEVVEDSYTITSTISNGGNGVGGTLSEYGVKTVPSGGSLSIDITPNSGFIIHDILVDGATVPVASNYTFSNVKANHTMIVTFSEVLVEPPVLTAAFDKTETNQNSAVLKLQATNNPTDYRICLDSELITDAVWKTFAASHTVTDLVEGENKFKVQAKNEYGVSNTVSVSITYTAAAYAYKSDVSFGWPWADMGLDPDSGVFKIQLATSAREIKNNVGVAVGTLQNKTDPASAFTGNFNSNIIGATTGDNSGIYPDAIMTQNSFVSGPTSVATLEFVLTPGSYKVGLFSSAASTSPWLSYVANPSTVTAQANGKAINVTSILDNTSTVDYSEVFETTDGIITFTATVSENSKRLPINVISIIKM